MAGVGRLLAIILGLGCGLALLFAGVQLGRKSRSRRQTSEFLEGFMDVIVETTGRMMNKSDFDRRQLPQEALLKLQALKDAEMMRPMSPLTPARARDAQKGVEDLNAANQEVLSSLKRSFSQSGHNKLIRAFELVSIASSSLATGLDAVVPVAAGRTGLSDGTAAAGALSIENSAKQRTLLTVTVAKRPFGMHVRTGTNRVDEVFPGFPAKKAGVRKGCEVESVAGTKVASGTWLQVFQQSKVPFDLVLSCGPKGSKPSVVGPLTEENGRIRVMVDKKPFGMNIQVHKLPRVVEVLAGYPAEKAGVRRSFVVAEVNDKPVDAKTWFRAYQDAKMPFTMTFTTNVPLHEGNPFFDRNGKRIVAAVGSADGDLPWPGEGFVDFNCSVSKLPFGMQISATPRSRPKVVGALKGFPAEKEGIRIGDVLVEVAGRRVTQANWFSAMQQAATPYGLLFRRPLPADATASAGIRLL